MTGGTPGGAPSARVPSVTEEIGRRVREVPGFPKPGISFKDITPLVEDGPAFRAAVDALAHTTRAMEHDFILCAEARGFVFGTALAYASGKGLVLARKPGKLPRETISASYDLEYGKNALEVHADSVPPGSRVLVVDDLLATGGTARAMCDLVEHAGGEVAGAAFLIELRYLDGRRLLSPRYDVVSLLAYDD